MRSVKFNIIFAVITGMLLLVSMLNSNPFSGGPIVVVGFLVLVYLLVFQAFLLLGGWLTGKKSGKLKITKTARYYISVLIASGCVYLLGLATIGQLQVQDVVLVICFEAVANFYILRRV